MIYRKNVGTKESVVRIVGGGLVAACAIAQLGATTHGLVLAASGVFMALTGAFGWCPACALVGRRPRSRDDRTGGAR